MRMDLEGGALGLRHLDGPHFFQIIELTNFLAKQVYDNIAHVDQRPIAFVHALDLAPAQAKLLDLAQLMVRHGAHMPVRTARGDDQIVRNGGFTVQVDDNQIFRLVVVERTIHECQQFLACRWLLACACYSE